MRHFPSLLPPSIVLTISKDSPILGSTHETCESWLKFYDNHLYRNALFYKGPLLALSSNLEVNLSLASYINMKTYKKNVKIEILALQGSGIPTEWQPCNFPLQNIPGLRKSCANYRVAVDYSEHYDQLNY